MQNQNRGVGPKQVRQAGLPWWWFGIAGLGSLVVGAEQLLRGVWVLLRSGSWSTVYYDPLFMDLAHSKDTSIFFTTPSQALRGEHLFLSSFFVLLGVYLLWRSLRERHANAKP